MSLSSRQSTSAARSVRFGTALFLALVAATAPCALAQSASGSDSAPSFEIGIGDVLAVFNRDAAAEQECLVRPDGRITLQLAGELVAAGRTPAELSAAIQEALAPFFTDPKVSVAVREIHSYRIYVLGEVNAQGSHESVVPLRLLQALSIAGGFNEFANKKVVILRQVGDEQRRIEFDTTPFFKGRAGAGMEDPWLLSGDVVIAK